MLDIGIIYTKMHILCRLNGAEWRGKVTYTFGSAITKLLRRFVKIKTQVPLYNYKLCLIFPKCKRQDLSLI